MKDLLSFRLAHNRVSRKNIMDPEFKSIVELSEDALLTGIIKVTGIKENNGNIQIKINPCHDCGEDSKTRYYQAKPLEGKKVKLKTKRFLQTKY